MKEYQQLLYSQLTKYPGMQPQDCIKLLYQATMGPGHLLEDVDGFRQRLDQELAIPGLITAQPREPEQLGNCFSRVYLSGFDKGPSPATFTRMCAYSAAQQAPGPGCYIEALAMLRGLAAQGLLPYAPGEVERCVDETTAAGHPQPCHSARYRALYEPHYRVLARDAAFYMPVFAAIDAAALRKPHILVAVDGMSGAGKSTLAALLVAIYGCGVVHCDDFFLQAPQRTPGRLAETGGNIHYERLAPIAARAADDRAFTYKAYNCQTGTLDTLREVPGGRITLLEGVYALHPKVGAAADVSVFLNVDATVQAARIAARCTPELAARFRNEWIPMENRYFTEWGIREGCDVVLDTSCL